MQLNVKMKAKNIYLVSYLKTVQRMLATLLIELGIYTEHRKGKGTSLTRMEKLNALSKTECIEDCKKSG